MARGLPPNKQYKVHFSRAKSPLALLSRFIMWAERRPYSHVSIELVDPASQLPLIFQAAKGMVNFFYKPAFEEHNLIVETYEVPTTALENLQIWTYAVKKMGSDYSWLNLVSIGLAKLFKVKSWFSDGDKSNICSELAARVCVMAKIPMPEHMDRITPSDFNKLIRQAVDKGLVRQIL